MGWITSLFTIVGAIAGSYIPGIGTGLGAALGAFIGVVVEGVDSQDQPKINEIRAQGASEGDPMQFGIGVDYRVAGEVIWRGNLFAHEPGVEKHPIMYQLPICISFGRTFTGEPALKITELLANGDPIYWNYDEVSITGTDIAATAVTISTFDAGALVGGIVGGLVPVQTYLDLSSSTTNLGQLTAGRDVTVGGFTAGGAVNNGTWRVQIASTNYARLYAPLNATYAFATAAAGNTITLFQAAEEKFLWPMWSSMEIGLGSVDQAPPTFMEAIEGAGNVPGLSGLIWVCFNNLPLNTFGVSVPTFDARIKERNNTELPLALKDIAVGMGVDECEIDTVDAAGIFYGYAIRAPKSVRDALAPLITTYNLVTQERDMTFRILSKSAATNVEIDETELGAQEGDYPEIIPRLAVTREDSKRLPAEVQFSYMDRDTRGETGSQPYRRLGLPLTNVVQVAVPVMLTKDQARQAAKRICYGTAVSSERHNFRLPPSRIDTYESDRLYTTSNGRERITLLTRVTRGNNYEMEMEGGRDDPDLYFEEDATGGDPAEGTPQAPLADPLALIADIPPLSADDVATTLLYGGATRESPDVTWANAGLYESVGGAYTLWELAESEAASGTTVGTVPSGSTSTWDDATTITVDFRGVVPSSLSDADLLAGVGNYFLVGGEVIGAGTITLVSSNRYTLTHLLRGLMDTTDRVASHGANETVMAVRPFSPLSKREYVLADVGDARTYDAAPENDTPDGVGAVPATLNGSTVRPFSPCLPVGTRNLPATNDWTVAFTPQTRIPLWAIFGSIPFDDAEATEVYQVEVWNSGFAALIRTITSTPSANSSVVNTSTPNTPFAVYDEADQIADFGSAQSTIRLRIYQVGTSTALRSKKLEVTLTG